MKITLTHADLVSIVATHLNIDADAICMDEAVSVEVNLPLLNLSALLAGQTAAVAPANTRAKAGKPAAKTSAKEAKAAAKEKELNEIEEALSDSIEDELSDMAKDDSVPFVGGVPEEETKSEEPKDSFDAFTEEDEESF